MPKAKTEQTEVVEKPEQTPVDVLAEALVKAINIAKPVEKKTPFNRKEGTPWTPKDGSPKLKLKRKMYQHGLIMDPDFLTNEEIDLLNQVKPGHFLNGWIKVIRRKDFGIDIDYPVRTASQRMRLSSEFRVHSLADLLQKCITEAASAKKPEDSE